MSKKPLVIYHGNCADGFTAAWCFWKKYGDTFEYYPGRHQTPPPDVSGRDVYLVDFSYKRPVVEGMLAVCHKLTLIDHHKSALEDLNLLGDDHSNYACFCSLDKSGARLAWEYVFGAEPPPYVLLHVEAKDLWRHLPGSREIGAVIFSYEYTFDNWNTLMAIKDVDGVSDILKEGVAIERKQHKDVAEIVKLAETGMFIGGHYVPVVNVPYTYGSDAGNLLCQDKPFAAYYYISKDGVDFGLRSSEKGLDVSAIAVLYGGGGHPHASGFRVSHEKFWQMFNDRGWAGGI